MMSRENTGWLSNSESNSSVIMMGFKNVRDYPKQFWNVFA